MDARSLTHRLVATSAMVLALTACTGAGSGDDGSPTPSQTPESTAAETDTQSPSLVVLEAPAGYQRDDVLESLSSDWSDILVADGGCTLAARGETSTGVTPDVRTASVDEVRAMATADGAADPGTADLELVTSGAGEDNDPARTLMFVSADWMSGDQAVRALARVTTVHDYDGSESSQTLALRFSCPGGAIDESEWETVAAVIRPVMHGVDENDPWADVATG
ncbi:hypothetical protein [Ruania alba]|uniref:Lipoprotein n=1 Tax=Ruania alba TaxID=648782 RepID=A0A1H5ECH8_9MICO|nr:hypothetical protein [Ruania alba]SED88746.1 hypothetical protein SAMN04488554_0970 [Ruania alba]